MSYDYEAEYFYLFANQYGGVSCRDFTKIEAKQSNSSLTRVFSLGMLPYSVKYNDPESWKTWTEDFDGSGHN
jgi:hypothetical protein